LRHRTEIICKFCREWRPDFFVVDQLPFGLGAELLDVFETADQEAWNVRFALGVKYAEGMPAARIKNPRLMHAYGKYALALAYNDPEFDPVLEKLTVLRSVTHRKY